MSSSGDFAQSVKQQADIVRIIGDYVKLKKSGAQNYTGLCPFHNEKTPSFSVHATRQFFHCFGCGLSGDVFSFVQRLENVTFPEAVRAVAQKAGIPLPRREFSSPAEAAEARLRGALIDMHEHTCAWFQEQLRRPEAAAAREYLAGRGLNEETLRAFRIGYAPDFGFLLRDHLQRDFNDEQMRASGLFSWKQGETGEGRPVGDESRIYSRFRGRIMFPIRNESGKVIAFTGRILATGDKNAPKYLNSPETAIYSKSRVLYNLDLAREAIRKLDYAILVEGQMDCIAVYAAGFHNVIASSGTAFTEAQVRLLARFSRKLVMSFDPDAAGAAAAERSLALLVGEDFDIKVLRLEPGLDPDLLIRRRGPQAYADLLRAAPRYFDFLLERARSQFSVRTPQGKVQALNFLLPHIQRVPSRIARDELAADLAQKLGVDSAVLRQELKHLSVTRSGKIETPAQSPLTESERLLVLALAASGDEEAQELRRLAAAALQSERLHEGLAAEPLLELLLGLPPGQDPLALPLPEEQRSLLAGLLLRDEAPLTPALLESALTALRRRRLESRRRHLRAQIAEAERRQDSAALARLLQEKVELDRALTSTYAVSG
jgi:DNA primase